MSSKVSHSVLWCWCFFLFLSSLQKLWLPVRWSVTPISEGTETQSWQIHSYMLCVICFSPSYLQLLYLISLTPVPLSYSVQVSVYSQRYKGIKLHKSVKLESPKVPLLLYQVLCLLVFVYVGAVLLQHLTHCHYSEQSDRWLIWHVTRCGSSET